eukprot:scaffold329_cov390-Pavlova_lutheri.AAC.11
MKRSSIVIRQVLPRMAQSIDSSSILGCMSVGIVGHSRAHPVQPIPMNHQLLPFVLMGFLGRCIFGTPPFVTFFTVRDFRRPAHPTPQHDSWQVGRGKLSEVGAGWGIPPREIWVERIRLHPILQINRASVHAWRNHRTSPTLLDRPTPKTTNGRAEPRAHRCRPSLHPAIDGAWRR